MALRNKRGQPGSKLAPVAKKLARARTVKYQEDLLTLSEHPCPREALEEVTEDGGGEGAARKRNEKKARN